MFHIRIKILHIVIKLVSVQIYFGSEFVIKELLWRNILCILMFYVYHKTEIALIRDKILTNRHSLKWYETWMVYMIWNFFHIIPGSGATTATLFVLQWQWIEKVNQDELSFMYANETFLKTLIILLLILKPKFIQKRNCDF